MDRIHRPTDRDKTKPTVQEKQRAARVLIELVGRLERERRGEPVLRLHRDDGPRTV